MVFKNGVINIQAAGYNGARTVVNKMKLLWDDQFSSFDYSVP